MSGQPEPGMVLARIGAALAEVPGVVGLALGGSHARGTACADSDIDVGLYYDPASRPAFGDLYTVIRGLDDRGEPDGFGGYGEWGPWINGGVWLRMSGVKTDILLRDTNRVRQVVADCAAGRFDIVYQVGHPHGFATTIYAAEVWHNVPFHDPDGVLAGLRAMVDPYPQALAAAIVDRFGFEAAFSLGNARSAARRGDAGYVCGCVFRTIACLNQILFAAEHRYLSNEKGAAAIAAGFSVAPQRYADRVAEVVELLGAEPDALVRALEGLDELRGDVMARVVRC